MSEFAYRPLTDAEQLFKDLIWSPALKIGETALSGAVPALALPVIKQIDDFVIDEIADWIFHQLVLAVDITAIKLVNAEHQSAFDKASVSLKIISKEKGHDSLEYKAAKEKAKRDLAKFLSYGAA